jgi:hypothetical protein
MKTAWIFHTGGSNEMALREFTDSRGTPWTAWDVPPHRVYTSTRSGVERRTTVVPGYAPERRTLRERRMRVRHPGLVGGWVCFSSSSEKRRLFPPPPEWHAATDEELEALCQRAENPSDSAA